MCFGEEEDAASVGIVVCIFGGPAAALLPLMPLVAHMVGCKGHCACASNHSAVAVVSKLLVCCKGGIMNGL